MRFGTLELLRYGALTDRRLVFRPDAKLHVIYGANEAGKSSALSAISDLLFGFPRETAHFAFRHDPKTLRIGALLENRAGSQLAFRRRRGVKNTLLDVDDAETPLSDDALLPFIGSLKRDVFQRAFGLDTNALRAGATEMLKSGGEIGSLLFSAASGLTGLSRLRETLESEADGIYAARKSGSRTFYQAIDRFEAARQKEKAVALSARDWADLGSQTEAVERALKALAQARIETRTRLDQLRTLRSLQPLLEAVDTELSLLGESEALAHLPSTLAPHLRQLLEKRERSTGAVDSARDDVTSLDDQLAFVAVDTLALAAAGQITSLFSAKGRYIKDKADLPAVRRELGGLEAALQHQMRRLGIADMDGLARAQPSDAARVGTIRLIEEGRALLRDKEKALEMVEEEEERLRAADALLDTSRVIDPKPMQQQLSVLSRQLAALGDAAAIADERASLERALSHSFSRLHPQGPDMALLLSGALPDASVISAFRARFADAALATKQAVGRLGDIRAKLDVTARQISDLTREGPLPTREDIDIARQRRDEALSVLIGDPSADPHSIVPITAPADKLSDRALAHAERVARLENLKEDQTAAVTALDLAEGALKACKAAEKAVETEYAGLFVALDIQPLPPEAMADWRRSVDQLRERREALDQLIDREARLLAAKADLRPSLQALADASGAGPTGSLPLEALVVLLQGHLDHLSSTWDARRNREAARAASADTLARLRESSIDCERLEAKWSVRFQKILPSLGLAPDATPDMAEASLAVWSEVPKTIDECHNRQGRVRGMERDIAEFEDRLRPLIDQVAPDLAGLPPEMAIDTLHDRAVEAGKQGARRAELERALAEARQKLLHAESASGDVLMAIEALPVENADREGGLPALLLRLEERQHRLARLSEARTRLLEAAQGKSELDIRAALSGFILVEAELDIENLETLAEQQVQKHAELTAQHQRHVDRRELLEGGEGAEGAILEQRMAVEEARSHARDWVVRKLASSMLARGLEKFREAQADPIMRRAGDLFSTLTGGSFARLVQDYNDRDELALLAERSSGERVSFSEGLSEGTGDQLYLALRLAFIEDYSLRNEPVPFIADDLFQTFDDERTVAGLTTLAKAGEQFQSILFTHQRSVVRLAEEALGADVDILTL